jgi:hypothetical protein
MERRGHILELNQRWTIQNVVANQREDDLEVMHMTQQEWLTPM